MFTGAKQHSNGRLTKDSQNVSKIIWSTMISRDHFPASANSLKPLMRDTGNVAMKFPMKLAFPALPVTNLSTSWTHPKLTKQHPPAQPRTQKPLWTQKNLFPSFQQYSEKMAS